MTQGDPAMVAGDEWLWNRDSGYRPLARFASVTALQPLGLHDRDAYQALAARLEHPGADAREAVREITRQLYEQMRSRKYPYAAPELYFDKRQRLRDPIAIHQDSGTCLDLSLMFAAMCTALGLRAFIAILEGHVNGDHALVLVDLASTPPGIGRPSEQGISGVEAPVRPEEPSGVSGVRQLVRGSVPVELTAAGVAIEITSACGVPNLDFSAACLRGEERLTDRRYEEVHLVDVLTCRDKLGEAALPAHRPAIYPSLPPMPPFTAYRSREKVTDELRKASGTVVLLGGSGTGKSMLAHLVAATADHGCGWFLDASSQQALTVALASEEAKAKGLTAQLADGPQLRVLARGSLTRLKNSTRPWAVVLDNANGDHGSLTSLPDPAADRGQLVIITTTNEAWDDGLHEIIRLPALPPDDVADGMGTADIPVELIAGRPLLIGASRRYFEATGRWWWADQLGTAESAPADFWAAVAGELGDGLPRTVAQAISWLPPVRIPVAALASVAGIDEVRAAVTRLRQVGLIDAAAGEVTMHQLFRAAVRGLALREDRAGQAELVARMLAAEGVQRVLESAADLATARQLGDLLDREPYPGAAVTGLYELGRVFERHGTAADSARWYANFARLAARPGGEASDELRLRRVNALVGMARAAMRGLSGSADERVRSLDEGIAWTTEAELLCQERATGEGDVVAGYRLAASHAKAMRGLLLRKRASVEPDGSATGLDLLRQAERALRDSYRERTSQFKETTPELDRSQFNLAGLEVRLAQRDDPAAAAEHLDEAWRHYTMILDERRRRYRTDELEEVVSCIHGQAVVSYYRATLLQGTWAEKTALLRLAAERAAEAVAIRQQLAGPADDLNTAKSLAIQAKIALARLAVTEAAGIRADRDETAIDVFRKERHSLLRPPEKEGDRE